MVVEAYETDYPYKEYPLIIYVDDFVYPTLKERLNSWDYWLALMHYQKKTFTWFTDLHT